MVELQIKTIQIIGLYLIAVTFLVKSECDVSVSHVRYYGYPDNEYEKQLLLYGLKRLEFLKCKNITFDEEPLSSVLLNNTFTFIKERINIDKTLLLAALHISIVNSKLNLKSETFQNFSNLTSLDLISNDLSTFDILPIPSLRNLDLSNNSLTSLNNTNFQNFNLTSLKASHNQLTTIYCSNVSTEIDLSYNQLVDSCTFSPTIQFINFSHNNITYLSYNDFSDLKYLVRLDLSYNFIRYISMHLDGLKELKHLNLSHNHIQNLYYNCFEGSGKIISIDLSYNRIPKISQGATSHWGSLRYLDLSYNNIYTLDIAAVFFSMQNIVELKLLGNVLKELDVKTLTYLLPNLHYISLGFSQISCNVLMNYIRELKNHHVRILKGPIVYEHNVHGIMCIPLNDTSPFENNFEYALFTMEKVHSLFVSITFLFIVILLMLLIINYYRYKSMRR